MHRLAAGGAALLFLVACYRPPAEADRLPARANPNCLTLAEAAVLRTRPTPAAAKRLARHYGACIYDGPAAMGWLLWASDRGDREATLDLATMLENMGPDYAGEVTMLREKAARQP